MMDKKTLDKNETKIAVVGLSCRYPGASNPKELWENILAGRRQFRDFPKKRLPVDQYTSKSNLSEGQKRFPQGAFIDGWSFDHLAWRIPKSTWESTDPVHWLALELAAAAIEIAGGAQKFSNRSTAVYVGNTLTGEVTRSRSMRLRWPFVKRTLKQVFNDEEMPTAEQDKYFQAFEARFNAPFPEVNEDTLAGSLSNTIAGRICNYFDFKGGGYTVDGACASSLLAIITACERLSAGTIDCALAGGVDISLDPFELIGFSKAEALAKGQLHIYDRRANGMMPGEGGGFVVLKRLEDAIKDQDTIYAELNGWGISSDGKGSITAPQSQGQSRALLTAWKKAGYEHSKIDFIEGHGTGTALGDPVELKGMNVALEQIAGSSESLCGVTSLKSIIGHTKAAAGIGALIKAILGVNQRVLPPTANCEYPHDVFHEKSNRLFPIRTAKQLDPSQCVYAGVSAMGFGGINAHVALSSSSVPHAVFMPSVPISLLSATYQRAEVFVVSGASENECMGSLDQLFEDCQGISLAEMTDLSRKTWSSEHGLFRAAIVARTSEELGEKINALKNSIVSYGFKEKHAPQDCFLGNHIKPAPIGIVFPGQGSQFIGAARTRFRRSQISDAIKEMALAVATPKVKEILLRAFDPEDSLLNEDEISAAIAKTDVAQIAITAASLAWWEWLSRVGLKATKISGHSLGEVCALYAAGGIDLKQALTIASIRGEAMAKSLQGGMVSLSLNKSDTQKFLSEYSFSKDPRDVSKFAVVANFNSPRQTIISASEEALARVLEIAANNQIRAQRIPVSCAFHSSYMQEAAVRLENCDEIPAKITLAQDFISSLDGMPRSKELCLRDYLAKQVVDPVDFTAVVDSFKDVVCAIEVGPGGVLSNLFRQESGVVCLPVESSYNSAEDHCAVLGAVFCLGHDLNAEVIFEGRWTKPFVPATEKDFIENPCEMFSDSDLPVVSFQKSEEVLGNESRALPRQEKLSDEPLTILFKHISQLTGFPISSLKPHHRLLDDLNLDSIKRFEIIERFAKDMHLSGDVGQIQADISLSDLVATIVEKAKDTVHDKRFESHLSPWVAAFEEFVTPETELVAQTHPWQGSDVLLVCDRPNFDQITMKLDDLSITPKVLTQIDQNIKIDEHINHLCIFLPKAKSPGSLKNFLLDLAAVLPYEGSLLIIDSHNAANSENFDDVASWCASIHLERANLRIRHVCIQDEYIDFANAILELSDDLPYRKVFYKDGERSKITYRYVYPKKYIERNPNLVLVTGGGKGITAQCALALAEKTKGIYILLGRSAVDDEIRSTLSKFKNLEVAVKYIQCDITNMNSVAEAIEQVISNFGKVDWLVHGAGYNSPQLIEKSDRIQVEKEMGAKLNGLSNILNALPRSPDRVIAITSIIGMLGMPGNAWYAYANASLHRFMEHWQQKHRNSSVLSLAYSVWNEIGMGARLGSVKRLSQLGVSALPVNMATKHFVDWALSNTGECRQVILMGRMKSELFDTWHQFPSPFQGRFVGEPHSEFQEVELVTDIKISLDSDPYLKDHKFGESFLFPTVFGLEAMAQGICRLLGKRPNDFSVHNLLLKKPILVMDGEEQVIRIHTYRTGADSFESAIYAKSSGFAKPHFSGSWTLSGIDYEQLNILDEPLNIEPSEVLYNKILFQGPLFQKIDKICMLNSREAVVKTNGGISDKSNWHLDIDSFVLGSPYRRDSLLQCGQLSITPRIGLPYKIDHWHLDCQNGARTIRSFITEDKTSSVLGDVWALKENRVVEKISGYAIKTIRTDQTLPNPEQILEADQGSRPNKFSDSKLSQLTSPDWENLTPSYYSFKEISPGLRGERRFRYRFPLSFSSVTEPSGTASLAEMAHWLGSTRELSLRPGGLYAAASRHVATNQFAWVTKETEFRVVGDVSAEDIIEVDFWTERIYGPESADVEMIYKWYKLVGDGSRAPVAECIQTTTWTEIVGHGLVVPASYPSDMQPFLESVLPPQRAKQEGLSWKVLNVLGEQIWQSPEPWRGHLLYKADFRTTSRNSNMVKNVYWANYTDWMVETRDLWLNDQMYGQPIELRTQTAHIQHLREAMVGDKIQVHMSVISVYEKGLELAFDIYRIESPVVLSKLARISQKAICLKPNKDGYWGASNLKIDFSRMIPKLNSMPHSRKREQEL